MSTVARYRPEGSDEDVILLGLTPYEAKVLAFIFHRIGGSPEGPRGVAENLSTQLANIEIGPWDLRGEISLSNHHENNIYIDIPGTRDYRTV